MTDLVLGFADPGYTKGISLVLPFRVKAGVTVAIGSAVYLDTDGTITLSDASAAGTAKFLGLVSAIYPGRPNVADVVIRGPVGVTGLDDLDYTDRVFLSDTPGALADAAGTVSVSVGLIMGLSDQNKVKYIYLAGDLLATN